MKKINKSMKIGEMKGAGKALGSLGKKQKKQPPKLALNQPRTQMGSTYVKFFREQTMKSKRERATSTTARTSALTRVKETKRNREARSARAGTRKQTGGKEASGRANERAKQAKAGQVQPSARTHPLDIENERRNEQASERASERTNDTSTLAAATTES